MGGDPSRLPVLLLLELALPVLRRRALPDGRLTTHLGIFIFFRGPESVYFNRGVGGGLEVKIVNVGTQDQRGHPNKPYYFSPEQAMDEEKIDRYRVQAREILASLGEASPYLAARLASKIAAYPNKPIQ